MKGQLLDCTLHVSELLSSPDTPLHVESDFISMVVSKDKWAWFEDDKLISRSEILNEPSAFGEQLTLGAVLGGCTGVALRFVGAPFGPSGRP